MYYRITLSENNEELELMCAKLAEEMAEKSAIVGQKKGCKRKRTEKGRDWDKEIGEETAQSGKQPPDIQSTTGSDSGKDDIQTSKSPKKYPPQKRKKITKTGEKQQKKPQEKQMQKTAECIAGKKQEKQKENQTQKTAEIVAEKKQKKPAKEKQVQKAAEIVARKTLATDFFSNVLNSSDRNAEKQKADAAQILIDDYDKEETDRQMAEKYDLTETASNSSQVQTAKRCEDRYICVQPVKSTTVHTPVTRPPLSTPLNTPVARPPVFTPSNNPQPHQLTPTVISVQTPVMQNGNTPVTPAVGNPVRTHEPAKTPLTPNNSVNAEPRIIDPATTSHRQQECGDFGGLFTTSLRLAYGDEPVNYSYLDDLHSEGEPRPLAAAESSACANCEVLMKEIEFLKQNQMPGTNFTLTLYFLKTCFRVVIDRVSITLYGKRRTRACLYRIQNKSLIKIGKNPHSRQTQNYSFPRMNAKRQTPEVEFLPFAGKINFMFNLSNS